MGHKAGVVRVQELRPQRVRILREGGEWGPKLDHSEQIHRLHGPCGQQARAERQLARRLHSNFQALWGANRRPSQRSQIRLNQIH